MVQIVGTTCVRCQKSIGSVLEGIFCTSCGNPYHEKCPLPITHQEGLCSLCGGDPNSPLAVEVQQERGKRPRGPDGDPVYLSDPCPSCGYVRLRKVRPEKWIAFVKDRKCDECGHRFSPRTPLWAALIFVLAGVLLAGFGLLSILLRMRKPDAGLVLGLWFDIALAVLGLLALLHGLQSLVQRKP